VSYHLSVPSFSRCKSLRKLRLLSLLKEILGPAIDGNLFVGRDLLSFFIFLCKTVFVLLLAEGSCRVGEISFIALPNSRRNIPAQRAVELVGIILPVKDSTNSSSDGSLGDKTPVSRDNVSDLVKVLVKLAMLKDDRGIAQEVERTIKEGIEPLIGACIGV